MRAAAALATFFLLAGAATALMVVSTWTVLDQQDELARHGREWRGLRAFVAEAEALRAASYAAVTTEAAGQRLEEGLRALEQHAAALQEGAGPGSEVPNLLAAVDRWAGEGPRVVAALVAEGNRSAGGALLASGREEELFDAVRAAAAEADAAYAREADAKEGAFRRAAVGGLLMAVVAGIALVGAGLAAIRAVREWREMSRRLRRARDAQRAAEELARARRELLTFATDELRGPATSITLAAELLAAEPDRVPPELRRRIVEDLVACARRLVLLSETLVDIVAAHTGRLVPVRERTDVVELLERVVRDVQLSRADFRPAIVVEGRPPPAFVDPNQVRRALAMLMAALLRAGAGQIELQVSTTSERKALVRIAAALPLAAGASSPRRERAAAIDPLLPEYLRQVVERQGGTASTSESDSSVLVFAELPAVEDTPPNEGEESHRDIMNPYG